MPKCPNCKKKIDYLLHIEVVKQYWKTIICDDQKDIEYPDVVDGETEETRGYVCPKCNSNICTEREEAVEFLKVKK